MGKETEISWCEHTFNPWEGCTKVGPGCDACYAEARNQRFHAGTNWGPGAPRRLRRDAYWKEPLRWDADAAKAGTMARVFAASLADVFDNEAPEGQRDRLFDLIRRTPNLLWMLVTKRIGNAAKMLPADWGIGWPNVMLLATVCNQEEADRDVIKLLRTPAKWRGLSMEPLLGEVDLTGLVHDNGERIVDALSGLHGFRDGECWESSGIGPRLNFIIAGGESEQRGHKPRPMHPDWVRKLRDDCAGAQVAFHFKQWGAWAWVYDRDRDDPDCRKPPACESPDERYLNLAGGHGFHGERVVAVRRVGKKRAGRVLDGRTHDEFPQVRP